MRGTLRRPSTWAWGLPLAVALVYVPFAVRQNAWQEWANYYWLVQRMAAAIHASGHPSLFLHEPFGIFYPQYAFYGGSLWAVAGELAVAIGSSWTAFLAILFAALFMAYLGSWWLGRQAGLSRLAAHAPALLVVTAPYALTNLYGRGDWAEIVATSALPLGFAGALSILRGRRPTARAGAAVVAAAAIVAGSHGITLLWGTLFALGLLGVLAVAVRDAGGFPWRRTGLVGLLAVLGVGVDLWYLLPDLAYAHHSDAYRQFLHPELTGFDDPTVVFSPLPHHPASVTGPNKMYMQAPVLPMLWGLAAGALARRSRTLWRVWLGLVALLGVLLVLVDTELIWRLPYFLRSLQFSFRLHAYVLLAVAGLAVVGLLAVRGARRPRAWRALLVGALGWQLGVAGWIAVSHVADPHFRVDDIRPSEVASPFSGYQTQGFKLKSGGPLVPKPAARVEIPPALALAGEAAVRLPAGAAGRRFETNAIWSPLVRAVGPAAIVGRDPDGFAVLAVRRDAAPTTDVVQLEGARPWPVTAGLAGTFVAAVAAAGLLVVLGTGAARRVRRRRTVRRPARAVGR